MHRTSLVAGLAVLLALAGALTTDAPAPARAAGSWTYNFESDLTPWSGAADACVTKAAFFRSNAQNFCPSIGAWSAALSISAAACAPTPAGVWMTARYAGDATDHVTLSWDAVSASGCGGCTPIYYVGASAPVSSTQFTALSPVLTTTWQLYSSPAIPLTATNPIYVAVGWTGPSSIATVQTGDLDCVMVQITSP